MPYRVTQLFGKDLEPVPDSSDAVDYYHSNLATPVTCGQVLARLDPILQETNSATDHKLSRDDFIITEPADIISATVEFLEKGDELFIISRKDGFPALLNKKITVNDRLVIDGDINFHTGNIDCSGDLLVNGSIMAGFKVKADNLTVNGSIENAEVVCHGDLVCSGGIVACNDFPLICGGSLWVKYIENSILEIKNDLFISGSSLHNSIKVAGSIVLCHDSAILVGGKCESGHSLYSGVIGAKWATPTEIIIGCDPFLTQKLKNHCQNLEKIVTELNELRNRIEQINIYLQHEEGKTTSKEAHKLQEERELLESKSSFITQKYNTALKKREQLQQQIDEFKKQNLNASLYVASQLFSGVNLTIKDATIRIDEEVTGVTVLSEVDEEIVNINRVKEDSVQETQD